MRDCRFIRLALSQVDRFRYMLGLTDEFQAGLLWPHAIQPQKDSHALPGKVLDVNMPTMLFVRPADYKRCSPQDHIFTQYSLYAPDNFFMRGEIVEIS